MQTLEFDSFVENGAIAVPSQYHDLITHSVRVIVLPKEETAAASESAIREKNIYSLAVDMTGFNFNRNEINER